MQWIVTAIEKLQDMTTLINNISLTVKNAKLRIKFAMLGAGTV